MKNITQAVILCGGRGTRLGAITNKIPKPMVEVCGKPFLEHLIIQLKKNGIKEILLLVGYKSELIKKYFSNGKKFNTKINYSYLPSKTDTGSRIYSIKKKLKKNFILLYSDNYSSLNIHKLYTKFILTKKKILFSLIKKNNGNCMYNQKSGEVCYQKKREQKNGFVEIGYMIINKDILDDLNHDDKNFSNFLVKISKKKQIGGIVLNNDYLSISDKKRLNVTRKLFLNNNYLLVDRDGVLNFSSKEKRYISNIQELTINKNFCNKLPKYSNIICITNQAGLSTKELTLINLKKIHIKIKKYLQSQNIFLHKFYVSGHHFNSKSLFRKPGPGLFFKASKEFKFILDKTFYIGDDKRDIEAAYNANTFIVYIGKKKLTYEEKKKYKFIILKKQISKLYNEKIKYNF